MNVIEAKKIIKEISQEEFEDDLLSMVNNMKVKTKKDESVKIWVTKNNLKPLKKYIKEQNEI